MRLATVWRYIRDRQLFKNKLIKTLVKNVADLQRGVYLLLCRRTLKASERN